jgi:cyclase
MTWVIYVSLVLNNKHKGKSMKKFLQIMAVATLIQAQAADVELTVQPVKDNIYMLQGSGGNIGVAVGKTQTLIIDDQFAKLSDQIKKAIATVSSNQRQFLINTHYHGDHTGGNANFEAQAIIMAHDNVRKRLVQKQDSGLPVVTYQDGIKIYLDDEVIHIMHKPNGHTDGDSVLLFEKANVFHMGDLFFESRFPYIDLKGGGTVDGYIKNVEHFLEKMNAQTKVIPGHGTLSTKQDLQKLVDMMKATRNTVIEMKKNGLTKEQAIAEGLGQQWKSWSWQFINEAKWIATLWH